MGSSEYPAWRERLAEANDPTFWPLEELDRLLTAGEAQFWCDGETAAVTRIVRYPGGALALETLAVTGTMDALWNSIVPAAEEYARSIGITEMHAMGRFGWGRAAQKHGWKPEMVVITKRIAHD